MAKTGLVFVLAAAAIAVVAGCGKSGGTKTTTGTTTTASGGPQIVTFSGPSTVPCGKKGEVHTVSFKYATKNATAVDPSEDGQAIGAQAGYDPQSGTMRFPYICPGPHTLTISASGHGKTVSRSATVVPESSG